MGDLLFINRNGGGVEWAVVKEGDVVGVGWGRLGGVEGEEIVIWV